MKGKVKFFDDRKGYGFIISDETKKEVFVHYTGINGEGHKTIYQNDIVEFDIVLDEKANKDRAINVTVIESANRAA